MRHAVPGGIPVGINGNMLKINYMTTKRPTTEESNYGLEMKGIGYSKGYNQCIYDARRRRSLKERQCFERFGHFLDYLDSILWENRRK